MKQYDVGGTTKMAVPMKPAGNVKSGRYSSGRGGDMQGTTFEKPPLPAGNHRKTLGVGKVRGHHRKG
jgi:hypothetical protein